jgi:hypothetical protein
MTTTDCPLLIVSCDKYADLWGPFFSLLRQCWPDCPLRLVLGTNTLTCAEPGVETLHVGPDVGWTVGLLKMLERLGTPRVLLMLEDFLLDQPVETATVLSLIAAARELDAGCLRLLPNPPPNERLPHEARFGRCTRGCDYRVSTQAAIWNVDTLKRVMLPTDTPWDFELKGSRRSDALDEEFYAVWRPVLHYRNGVERGRWIRSSLAWCAQSDVPVDLARRPVMTLQQDWYFRYRNVRGLVARHSPRLLRKWWGSRVLAPEAVTNIR